MALLNRIQIDAVDANFLLHHEETLFYCYRGLSAALCDESSRMSTWDTIASKYKQIFATIDNSDQHELSKYLSKIISEKLIDILEMNTIGYGS